MRIPLDYYRILGLPIQATADQLQQAHRDRALQVPRRGYSEAAIAARKQLIDEAFTVLSDPGQRQTYDATFLNRGSQEGTLVLPITESSSGTSVATSPLRDPSLSLPTLSPQSRRSPVRRSTTSETDSRTPSLEIRDEQLVGALLILLELGEYELVLRLGQSSLTGRAGFALDRFAEPSLVQSDIILTVALACLELGREQWQQGQYESAATSLDVGQDLLLRAGLFASVRGEIQADLYKLRPYRVLELLALSEDHASERQQGMQLLRDMLQERGGIDGTGNDQSGLSIDDFLRFIQQLRSYLTAAEQQVLFEEEARRPSAVATYLAVYALIGRGFAQSQPALIRRAKIMLSRLGSRQDVSLEQAVCALLLGQTEEASKALEHSHEYEPLAFIEEHSQGSPDLLPGLCLYSERWLQEEVFPHFRDLIHQHVSLKDYFADVQVQAYLEELPNDSTLAHEFTTVAPRPMFGQAVGAIPAETVRAGDSSSGEGPGPLPARAPARDIPVATATTISDEEAIARMPVAVRVAEPERRVSPPVESRRSLESNGGGDRPRSAPRPPVRPSPDESPSRRAKVSTPTGTGEPLSSRRAQANARSTAKSNRLLLLTIIGVVGIGALVLVVNQAYSWIKGRLVGPPLPELQAGQPMVQLDQPPIVIPAPTATPAADRPLDQATAQQLVDDWLTAKAEALGPDYKPEKLAQVLTEPALSRWQKRAAEAKQDGWYWKYQHKFTVTKVEVNPTDAKQALVDAEVQEVGELYEGGQVNQDSSYDKTLQVRYSLARKDGQWLIQDIVLR